MKGIFKENRRIKISKLTKKRKQLYLYREGLTSKQIAEKWSIRTKYFIINSNGDCIGWAKKIQRYNGLSVYNTSLTKFNKVLRKFTLTKVIKKYIMTKNANLGVLLYEIYKKSHAFCCSAYCPKGIQHLCC